MTGVANRRAFLHGADEAATRHGGHPRPAAVLLIDLDRFKWINDGFGHAVGNRVLEAFAQAARDVFRPADMFGRLGGEEFAALLVDVSPERPCEIAEVLRERFALEARAVDEHAVKGTVSIGVAHCDGPVLEVPELLAQADRALYFAKENGRNRVQLASFDLFSLVRGTASAGAPAGARSVA